MLSPNPNAIFVHVHHILHRRVPVVCFLRRRDAIHTRKRLSLLRCLHSQSHMVQLLANPNDLSVVRAVQWSMDAVMQTEHETPHRC